MFWSNSIWDIYEILTTCNHVDRLQNLPHIMTEIGPFYVFHHPHPYFYLHLFNTVVEHIFLGKKNGRGVYFPPSPSLRQCLVGYHSREFTLSTSPFRISEERSSGNVHVNFQNFLASNIRKFSAHSLLSPPPPPLVLFGIFPKEKKTKRLKPNKKKFFYI